MTDEKTRKNKPHDIKGLKKKALEGCMESQRKLGFIYYADNKLEDHDESMKWYHMAAEQGCVWSQFHLGEECIMRALNRRDFVTNELVEPDYPKGIEWYTKASEGGHILATGALAALHQNGWGVEKDIRKALEIYKKIPEKERGYYLSNLIARLEKEVENE